MASRADIRLKLRRLARLGIWACAALAGWAFLPAGGSAQEPGVPFCFGKPATLAYPNTRIVVGTAGNDVIVTGGGTHLVDGKQGNDLICAGGGHDVITGGSGNDKVQGQAGNDNLSGGPGNDRLKGNGGRDLLNGNGGKDDRCYGGGSYDIASPKHCETIRSAVTRL